MRALVYHGPGEVRCEVLSDPVPPGVDGAVVEVRRSAICGSDLHIYRGAMGEGPFPIGHEAIGEVVEVGSRVRRFRAGDRVLVAGVVGCLDCTACGRGAVTECEGEGGRVFGTHQGLPGAQAEALAVPDADRNLHRIPDGLTDASALLLTDVLPTGYFGALNAEIEPGQDVAVIGCGPVGLLAILAAGLFAPRRIFALDRVPERLEAARGLGAEPCDVSKGAMARILEATEGRGCHAVIEAVGADATIRDAVALVRRGGRVSVIGVNTHPAFEFPMGLALVKGITLRIGVCPVPRFWPQLVPLLQGRRIEPDFVFTHRMGLGEGPAAYELFDTRRDGVLKVMLDPGA